MLILKKIACSETFVILSRVAQDLHNRLRFLSVDGKDWEDEGNADRNELIDVIESIIRECRDQKLKVKL